MRKWGKEVAVGGFVLSALLLLGVFIWFLGGKNPFSRSVSFDLLYSFVGGVEVGAPVRVSGVKVGKVESIEFLPKPLEADNNHATVKLHVSVSQDAAAAIREDSRFFINMAGIIGERYIEVSPGSAESALLKGGSTVRGVDPPRIDQLLSQGYGVFGRIQDFLDENEKTLTEFLGNMSGIMKDMNQLLKGKERAKWASLLDNLTQLTGDLKSFTHQLKGKESKRFFEQLSEMVERAYGVDRQALKKFLQEEGIRARIF